MRANEPLRIAALVNSAAERLADAGVEFPRLEAQLLLAHLMRCTRIQIVAETCGSPTPDLLADYAALVTRRAGGEPSAYITGRREFFGLSFAVSPAVLIPRPETEMLVELVLDYMALGSNERVCADVGAGSGCVGIAVAVKSPSLRVLSIDNSSRALEVVRTNAEHLGVKKRVRAVLADLLSPLPPNSLDIVVSNPPYIPAADIPSLQREVTCFEPHSALDGGVDGLDLIRRIVEAAGIALKAGGFIAIEIGEGQHESVLALFKTAGFLRVTAHCDLAGIPRVISARSAMPAVFERLQQRL